MRKNSFGYENVRAYCTYRVRGVNLDALLNTLARRGVEIEKAEKTDPKTLFITLKFSEKRKFFAIISELCYTDIKRVKTFGRDYPLVFLFKNAGLILGAIIFIVSSFFIGDRIFSVTYKGSGKTLYREAEAYLNKEGVAPFTRFSEINLETLADGILASSPRLSFVSCTKRGNRLVVELVLSEKERGVLRGDCKELLAEEDGVVESIKVYRGTAKVKAGDSVKKGEILATGTAMVGEEETFVGLIGSATLLVEKNFTYYSENDGEEKIAEMLAENRYGDNGCGSSVIKTEENGEYKYVVAITYRRVLSAL